MVVYEEIAEFLTWIGFVDVVLPFIIVFILIYAGLARTSILGDDNKKNAVVAFCTAFFVVLAANVLQVMHVLLRNFVFVFVFGFLILLLVGFTTGATPKGKRNAIFWLFVIMFVLAVLFAFIEVGMLTMETFMTILLPLLLIGSVVGVVAYVLRGVSSKDTSEKVHDKKPSTPKGRPEITLSQKDLEKPGVIWKGK